MEPNEILTVLQGDVLEQLRTLPDESIHCCVTSPPYWGLRDYSTNGQIGLEKTPEEYVAKMVEVFREVRRVLRKDGTLWLNLGDSYASASACDRRNIVGNGSPDENCKRPNRLSGTLKEKDLCGIPWRVAFALQADGWWLRSDCIWNKPNPMPESVTDRPTKAHEYLFLLTKSANYFYDAETIKERASTEPHQFGWKEETYENIQSRNTRFSRNNETIAPDGSRNKRSVWTVATAPYPEAHFATYPPDLIKPCILAGTSAKGCCAKCGSPWERQVESKRIRRDEFDPSDGRYRPNRYKGAYEDINGKGDAGYSETKTIGWQPTCRCDSGVEPCVCLDPFAGSGTTGAVALELGRKAILIELNPKYVELIKTRCNITPGLQLA